MKEELFKLPKVIPHPFTLCKKIQRSTWTS